MASVVLIRVVRLRQQPDNRECPASCVLPLRVASHVSGVNIQINDLGAGCWVL